MVKSEEKCEMREAKRQPLGRFDRLNDHAEAELVEASLHV